MRSDFYKPFLNIPSTIGHAARDPVGHHLGHILFRHGHANPALPVVLVMTHVVNIGRIARHGLFVETVHIVLALCRVQLAQIVEQELSQRDTDASPDDKDSPLVSQPGPKEPSYSRFKTWNSIQLYVLSSPSASEI